VPRQHAACAGAIAGGERRRERIDLTTRLDSARSAWPLRLKDVSSVPGDSVVARRRQLAHFVVIDGNVDYLVVDLTVESLGGSATGLGRARSRAV
jgi:hypothetical protein